MVDRDRLPGLGLGSVLGQPPSPLGAQVTDEEGLGRESSSSSWLPMSVPKEVAGLAFRCPRRGHLSASDSSRRCKIHSPLPWLQVSPPGKNL